MSIKMPYKAGAIIAAAALALAGCQAQPAQAENATPEPITVTVGRGDVASTVTATGSITADATVKVSFEVSGELVEIYVDEGDHIEAGDPIAAIDDSDLQDAVANAEIGVEQARIALEQASQPAEEYNITSAQASLAQAQAALAALYDGPTDLERQQAKLSLDQAKNTLWAQQASRDATAGSKASSGAAKDSAEAAVLNAEVSVQQAQLSLEQLDEAPTDSQIASARAQVASAQAAIDALLDLPDELSIRSAQANLDQAELQLHQAQDNLAKATLRAPFSGTITDSTLTLGEYAVANQPVVSLARIDPLYVTATIDEIDIADLTVGQQVVVTFDALPDEQVMGELTYIPLQGSSTLGIATYDAEITLDETDAPLRLGMTANIEVIVAQANDVLIVPNQAITTDREAGISSVQVKSGSGFKQVEVKLGIQDEDYAQVLEGLEEGDEVQLVSVAASTDSTGTVGFGMGAGGMR